jgi:UDP-2-acetamido-2-deoxy-ribo-hexuluronate aminotransferase
MLPFVDLQAQYRAYQSEIDSALQGVLSSGAFINGPEVTLLETELTAFCNAGAAVACASGTDALLLALMALELKPGDEVIVPDFTFFATAEMVALLGGVPVFADIAPVTFNLDPASVQQRITPRTKGIIAVSIFGQCADFHALQALASQHNLWIIEDGAQSFGATYHGSYSCTLTEIATTSFFPAKPLGCYGDGGAVFTRDPALADKVRLLLNHGSRKRYHHEKIGINGRLDSMQAAILRVKLRHFKAEIAMRNQLAERYTNHFVNQPGIIVPQLALYNTSTWAQYTLRVQDRAGFIADLQARGVPTSVHYPTPLQSQPCFAHLPALSNPATAEACQQVVSLPLCAFADADKIFAALG